MQLSITTPEHTLFEGEVTSVSLPGIKGRFQVLEHHAPLISTLAKGTISYTNKVHSTSQHFTIESGLVEVHKNKVIVLASAGAKIVA